ncbi:hypothetical protein FGIG_01228 [Fasciola gigantica]|uniref:Uncharacterized protein n=1 Tax=Fasciola gigantica TaxID=46835 RepID=A0A504ZDB3_FASGI|nr:hypothetical protein FGIG_01228 [Fasciola gigantica]
MAGCLFLPVTFIHVHTNFHVPSKDKHRGYSYVTDRPVPTQNAKRYLDGGDNWVYLLLWWNCLSADVENQFSLRSFMGNPVANTGPTDPNIGQRTRGGRTTTDLSGLGLQYCHARLCSLERRAIQSGIISSDSVHSDQTDLTVLCEKIDQLDSTLWTNANQSMELKLLNFLTG